jgi:hypothetical protein
MATLEDILAELKKINDAVGEKQENLENSNDLLSESEELHASINDKIQKELEVQKEIKELLGDKDKLTKGEIAQYKSLLKISNGILKNLKEQQKEAERSNKKFEKTLKLMKGIGKAVDTISKQPFTSIFNPSAIADSVFELDNLEKSLLKTGAVSGRLQKQLVGTSQRLGSFAITAKDTAQGLSTLINSTTQFTNASKKNQVAIADTVIALEKGLKAGTEGAQAFELLATVFGKTDMEAKAMVENLTEAGSAMGIPPQQMLASFAQAAPRLALYGDSMERELIRLAATSKATGASMSELVQISAGFDTFEEAARKTSQLNAMFGTQLNSVDLLNMSESERIETLREQLRLQGKSVETLGKYELLSLSSILGVDAATLKKGFSDVGDEIDTIVGKAESEDKRDFGKIVTDAISAQERFEAALNRVKNVIAGPLTNILNDISDFLEESGILKGIETFFKTLTEKGRQAVETFAGLSPFQRGLIAATTATAVGAIAVLGYKIAKGAALAIAGKTVGAVLRSAGFDPSKLGGGTAAAPKPTATPRAGGNIFSRGLKGVKGLGTRALGALGIGVDVYGRKQEGQSFTQIGAGVGSGLAGAAAGGKAGAALGLMAGPAAPLASMILGFLGAGAGYFAGGEISDYFTGVDDNINAVPIDVQSPAAPRQLSPAEAAAIHSGNKSGATTSGNPQLDAVANQIADKVAKSFNPVINMTAYVGDKQTTVRLVKDALNSSYPLGRATTGG